MTVRVEALTALQAGMALPFGGDRLTFVSQDLAEAFTAGDALVICQSDGALLHIPAAVREQVALCVTQADAAFHVMRSASADRIVRFFSGFAERLAQHDVWQEIEHANASDVIRATGQGRDVGRLTLRPGAREAMIAGLEVWAAASGRAREPLASLQHGTWSVESHAAPVGTIGFVFEGRPNVMVDACGVLASGNTAVLRIGRDASATAEAIAAHALYPAMDEAGLPRGAVSLIPPLGHAAAWALFTDRRLALAIARGSGAAVRRLGDLASQSGLPVSLHGVGGAWLVADASASAERFAAVVEASLDRKVCNTLNTCCIVRSRAADLVPVLIDRLRVAAQIQHRSGRLHVLEGSEAYVADPWFKLDARVDRHGEEVLERFATSLSPSRLSEEWEWERTPEVTLVIVDDLQHGIDLLNAHSPRFVASLIAQDEAAQTQFYDAVDAPFVGDGFTRWVDGQYALNEPELGLSNWEFGRPLGRAAVLTGAGTHTVRLRMRQTDPKLRR